MRREVTQRSNQSEATLQDTLNITDWDTFQRSFHDNVNMFTEAVVKFIGKLVDNYVPKATFRTFPNQNLFVHLLTEIL